MRGLTSIRGLSIRQPWASLIAEGNKRIETRSWSTTHRGLVAIHASKAFPKDALRFAQEERALGRIPPRIPRGAIVAVARIGNVIGTDEAAWQISGLERHLGDYSDGRYAWYLEDVRALEEPIPCRGALSLWKLPPEVHLRLVEAFR